MTKPTPKPQSTCPVRALSPIAIFCTGIIAVMLLMAGIAGLFVNGLQAITSPQNAPTPAVATQGETMLPEVTGYDQLSSQTFRHFIRHPHFSLTTTSAPQENQ